MNLQLEQIEVVLGRIERLAGYLSADTQGQVRRSATELRDAFDTRGAVEPAVERVLDSIRVLRRNTDPPFRRELQRRPHGLDRLEHIIAQDLLPRLRRVGFEV